MSEKDSASAYEGSGSGQPGDSSSSRGSRSTANSSSSAGSAGSNSGNLFFASRRVLLAALHVFATIQSSSRVARSFSFVVALLEIVQVSLFALDAPGADDGHAPVVRGLRYLSAAPTWNWQIALLSFLGFIFFVEVLLIAAVARAKVFPSRWMTTALSYLMEANGALIVPTLHMGASFAICSFGGGFLSYFPTLPCWGSDADIALAVVGVGIAVVAIVICVLRALCYFPITHRSRHSFARLLPFADIVVVFFQVLLVLATDLTFYSSIHWLHNISISSTLIVFGLAQASLVLLSLPYYSLLGNGLRAAAAFVAVAMGAVNLVLFALNASGWLPYLALEVAAVLGCAVGVAAVSIRARALRSGRSRLPADNVDSSQSETPKTAYFRFAFQVELATRLVSDTKTGNEVELELQKERAEQILQAAGELLENSWLLPVIYALFVIEHKDDKSLLVVQAKKARERSNRSTACEFYLLCIDRLRRVASDKGDHAEEIDAFIEQASKYKHIIRKKTAQFWMCIFHEESAKELSTVLAHVNHYEKKARTLFNKLLTLYPRSPRVLRAYGSYVEEVEKDAASSRELYAQAEDIEEHEAMSKRKHFESKHGKKKRSSRVHPVAEAEQTIPALSDEGAAELPGRAGGAGHVVSFSPAIVTELNVEESGAAEPPPLPPQPEEKQAGTPLKRAAMLEELSDSEREAPHQSRHTARPADDETGKMTDAVEAEAVSNERALYRSIRERIYNTRSRSHRYLQISVFVTPLVFIVCIIAMYVSTRVVTSTYSSAIGVLDKIEQSSRHMHALSLYTRLISSGILTGNDGRYLVAQDHFAKRRLNWAGVFNNLVAALETESDSGVLQVWNNLMPIKFYFPTSNTFAEQTMALRSFGSLYLSTTQSMIDSHFPASEYGANIERSINFRFLFDNCPSTVKVSFDSLCTAYLAKLDSSIAQSKILLGVGIAVSLSVLLGISVILFRTAITQVRKERTDLLRLFRDVPKHAVAELMDKESARHRSLDVAAGTTQHREGEQAEVPVLRQLTLRFTVAVVAMVVLLVVLFAVAFTSVARFEAIGPALGNTGATSWLARRLHWLAVDLGFMGIVGSAASNVSALPLSWPGGAADLLREANKSLTQLKGAQNVAYYSPGGLKEVGDATIDDLLYTRQCQKNPSQYLFLLNHSHLVSGCGAGMEQLLTRDLNRLQEWFALPLGLQNLSSPLYTEIHELDLGQLSDWLQEALTDLEAVHIASVSAISQRVTIVFAVSFPVVVLAYMLLAFLVGQVQEENLQTMLMLLTVPVAVLDSVSSIRQFLETGESATGDSKMAAALEESNVRTKSILEAAADAIVVVNEFGTVEVFNRAAVKMFGYTTAEAIGSNFSRLLPMAAGPDTTIEKFYAAMPGKEVDGTALHRNGTEIPVVLSLSKGSYHGMVTYAAFMRDQRELNRYKELVEENQQLLCNMLPVAIAGKVGRARKKGTVIAKEYANVTVLFADIVGFTAFAMRHTAAELVTILDSLFRGWDELLERYGVEKIKTIGDAYMACAGAPTEASDHAVRIVEFAVDMFSVMQRHNTLSGDQEIQIRVGINTGSVIGGVIGTRRMLFDLWGPVVNLASRMESTGIPGRIQVTAATQKLLCNQYEFEERKGVEVKGEGVLTTYLLVRKLVELPNLDLSASSSTFSALKPKRAVQAVPKK